MNDDIDTKWSTTLAPWQKSRDWNFLNSYRSKVNLLMSDMVIELRKKVHEVRKYSQEALVEETKTLSGDLSKTKDPRESQREIP